MSSLISIFRKFFPPRPQSHQGYRVFTTRFDREVKASDLNEILGEAGRDRWLQRRALYAEKLVKLKDSQDIAAVKILGSTLSQLPASFCKDTVVSVLLDHSGSLRGQRAMFVRAATESLVDFLSRLKVKIEVLGFTTDSWGGGASRTQWNMVLRPKNPGRLCDLLHIIYCSADDGLAEHQKHLDHILRDELLKENVDGEAVLWAASRLKARPERNKFLLVLSDGAPVDDSTLLANSGHILSDHLHEVIEKIEADDSISLAGIGIDEDASVYYPRHLNISTLEELDDELVSFVSETLVDRAKMAGGGSSSRHGKD